MSRDTPRDAQNVSGVAIDAEPAGFFRRTAALAYDLLLLAGILLVFTLATFVLRGAREIPPGTLWFQISLLALVGAFFAGFWVHGGQTLGMRAWRLRVVGHDGRSIGWSRALRRLAAGLLALLPAGLGYLWALFDRERLGWHDRLSGTRLIYEAKPRTPPARTNAPEKTR